MPEICLDRDHYRYGGDKYDCPKKHYCYSFNKEYFGCRNIDCQDLHEEKTKRK